MLHKVNKNCSSEVRGTSADSSRIVAFDLARGFALLFMVMVHVLQTYGAPGVQDSTFGYLILFLGSPPAAPVFMFLMGASLAFSRRASIKRGFARAVQLLLLAYALNFFRGTLPVYLGLKLDLITLKEVAPWTPAYAFWTVDILHLAAVAYILISLLRHFVPHKRIWLIISGVVAFGSPLLWGRMSGNAPLDWLLTLLWGTGGEYVAFPVFPWASYPITGMAFGFWLSSADNHDRVFARAVQIGLCLLAVGTALTLTNISFHIGDYWRSGPGVIVWITGFVTLWLGALHWLRRNMPNNIAFTLLSYWSRNVTVFYFIQWILICWALAVLDEKRYGVVTTIILMAAIILSADLLTRLYGILAVKTEYSLRRTRAGFLVK